jgi:hypothetical protein
VPEIHPQACGAQHHQGDLPGKLADRPAMRPSGCAGRAKPFWVERPAPTMPWYH